MHGRAHAHHHAPSDTRSDDRPAGARRRNVRRLSVALGLVLLCMVAEAVGAWLTGSLALLADAGHMLSDAGSLGLALFAMWFARRPAPAGRTYGYYRAEILAALAHGATLVAVAGFVYYEAFRRFRDPPPVEGGWMMAVAAGGLLVNLAGLWILHEGREESLNVRGAWLHVLTDTLGSAQAVVAGGLILWQGWYLADPIASLLIAVLVTFSAWKLVREAVAVLMEGAPGHLDVDDIRDAIRGIRGVDAVHDLHVWSITTGLVALSAHVVTSGRRRGELLTAIGGTLEREFGIRHTTIQVEPEDFEGVRCEICEAGRP